MEFIQGIPLDLEKDSFLNPRMRNLIILDDLMSTASKDPRITDLFTEGSHHRNLSIIALNQNLYFSKDPTQRRNCHYLVLFNNPVDVQPVVTLARQMYPGKTETFMKQFEQATQHPYGYLLVDLKPRTPTQDRLRPIAFTEKPINRAEASNMPQFDSSSQREQTCEEELPEMSSCDDCGLMFQDTHDLQRHVKKWCPEGSSEILKRKREDEDDDRPANIKHFKWKTLSDDDDDDDESEDDDSDSDEENNEHLLFDKYMSQVHKTTNKKWVQRLEKYQEEGLSETQAKRRADAKTFPENITLLLAKYKDFIKMILHARSGPTHRQIMEDVKCNLTTCSEDKAIHKSLRKNRHDIEELFTPNEYESENDEDTDEDDDSSDEKDDVN